MLRLTVLLLLAANGLYFAWANGLLAALGWQPASVREPHRLSAQIKPEAIVVQTQSQPKQVSDVPSQANNASNCWQSDVLPTKDKARLNDELSNISNSQSFSYRFEPAKTNERWIIYMGPYANPQALSNKKTELGRMRIAFEALQNPELEPGISLGAFSSKQDAESALSSLNLQGVRTAKVSLEFEKTEGVRLLAYTLKANEDASLASIKDALGSLKLQSCPTPASSG